MACADKEECLGLPRCFIWGYLIALVLVAAYIRVDGVGYYHYSHDEALHVSIAKGETLKEVLQFSLYEAHPPLFYVLLHYWRMISEAPSFMRGFSLFAGLSLIGIYYRIGQRLNGSFTGLICATLIAFSHGLVIQSFLIRNYGVLLFFASLSFYGYLQWREKPGAGHLLRYALPGFVACLTNFSGITTLFCIAACETLRLYVCKAPARLQLQWVGVNAALGAAAAAISLLWLPAMPPFHAFFAYQTAGMQGHFYWLLFPLSVYAYMLPYWGMPDCILFLMLACAVGWAAVKDAGLRVVLMPLLIALALGMALVALSGPYPFLVGRHNLWMVPLLVPVVGWTIAYYCMQVQKILPHPVALHWPEIALVLLLVAGGATYNASARFSEIGEYPMPEQQWQDFTQYLSKLDSTHLIVAGRTDTILMEPAMNPYAAMNNGAFSGQPLALVIPYFHTHILFDQYDVRLYDSAVLLKLMQEGRAEPAMAAADKLVFLNTDWASDPLVDLLMCPALDKEIVTFPATAPRHVLTREEVRRLPATLLIVPKTEFYNQVIAPGGKAHGCLTAK